MFPLSRIATIALVAALGLGALASAAQAGQVGLVDVDPENSPAPDRRHVILYGETAEDFLGVYTEALKHGFVWLTAPTRAYVRSLDAEVWMVMGYLDPEVSLTHRHDMPDEGRMELEDGPVAFKVVTLVARSADELIQRLQVAHEHHCIVLTLPRYGRLADGRFGWTMDALLWRLVEEEATTS